MTEDTVAALGTRLARKDLSPVELVEHCLERCERFNPRVNALIAVDAHAARTAARAAEKRAMDGMRLGPLDGIPVTIKDNIFVRGYAATWGSRLYRDFRPERDDICVERLRAAGAVILGKTNTPEFALSPFTDNLVFGATRNPWAPELTPGGSSGGTVAALALGIAPLGVGTDAGGSIRRPASYAGVVGLRPSTGRVPRAYGFPPLAHDFQAIAPAARTVEDVYLLLRAMAGPDARDRLSGVFASLPANLADVRRPRMRIRCVLEVGRSPVDPQVKASVEHAAKTLSSLGHAVESGPTPYAAERIDDIWATLSAAGLARVLQRHKGWHQDVHPSSKATAERGAAIEATQYFAALDDVAALRLEFTALFETIDMLLMPASSALPWPLGQPYPATIDGRQAGPRGAALFATFVNAAGLPAISVPGTPAANGLPIGVQLVGRFGDDAAVMALAAEYEQAQPWAGRWPAIARENASEKSTT